MKAKYSFVTLLLILVSAAGAFAAMGPPPMGPPMGPPCWPPPCIPFDGGLSFLLVAGAAYGGKKLYDFRKKKDTGKAE